MKSHTPALLLLLLALVTFCHAFTKEDHEIFRLRDEIIEATGEDTSFYTILGVKTGATQKEINQALRKNSLKVHPDKAIPSMLAKLEAPKLSTKGNKKVRVQKGPTQKQRAQVTKEANEAYARYRSVANVLQTQSRERYDHFLKNGFPKWKGSGYYYARFRPGLGAVLTGLAVVFFGGGHYLIMYINSIRHKEFAEKIVTDCRKKAWGNNIPGIDAISTPPPTAAQAAEEQGDQYIPRNRRERRMQDRQEKKPETKKDTKKAVKAARTKGISAPIDAEPMEGPQGSRKVVTAFNGREFTVDSSGDVYLVDTTAEGDRQEHLVDPSVIERPKMTDTMLCRAPIWLFNQSVGRLIDKVNGTVELQEEGILTEDGVSLTLKPEGEEGLEASTALNLNGEKEAKKRRANTRK